MPRRNVTPGPSSVLGAPLLWAGGGTLLWLSLWLASVIALFRAFARLFH
jgi:hypothetical protein